MSKNLKLGKKTALLLTGKTDRLYYSGINLDEGIVVKTDKSVTLFTDARYFGAYQSQAESNGVDLRLYKGYSDLKAFFKENKIKKFFLKYNVTTVSELINIKKQGVSVSNGATFTAKDREIKSDKELSLILKGCEITFKALEKILPKIKAGVTEKQIATLIEKEMKSLGAEGTAFDSIVAFGANSAIPHHETGDTVLKENQVVLIDIGAKYKGYSADLTRTYFYGKPDDTFIKRYNAVLTANEKAEKEISVGILGKRADAIAREYLKGQNLDKYFTHSLGHGLGLDIHESPTLSPKGETPLSNGMAFTIEPGVYFDNEYGIRIEDTVYLSNGTLFRAYTDDKGLKTL